MSKHTPGPWRRTANFVIDNDGVVIASPSLEAGSHKDANADLIAAAPELLEALRDMVFAFDETNYGYEPGTNDHSAAKAARAAIAKAEGRS